MNIEAKPISTRYEIYLEEKEFKAVSEYNESLTVNRQLERVLYDNTNAIDIDVVPDLEGGYIFFTLPKLNEYPAEHKAIITFIGLFMMEALEPEIYGERFD